jgi:sulfotransferase
MEKIFFNSSLPRAGSTLIQNILGQNPDFYVTPTSGVLELVFGARANYTASPEFKAQDANQMKNGFTNFCNKGMQGFFEAITDKKYVVDKSRGWGIHYSLLNEIYPNPKIIVMVRDLREIITSMEKKFRKHQLLHDPIINHSTMSGTSTHKRMRDWLNSQPVGLAVERIGEIHHQKLHKNMMFVRYEDLLTYPNEIMDSIYKYLEIENYKHDFNNIEQITVEDDSIYGIYGDHNIKNKLEPVKYDYPEILGEYNCNWLYDNYKWYFDIFGYKK